MDSGPNIGDGNAEDALILSVSYGLRSPSSAPIHFDGSEVVFLSHFFTSNGNAQHGSGIGRDVSLYLAKD
jgi:hypothetical protein